MNKTMIAGDHSVSELIEFLLAGPASCGSLSSI